MAGGKKERKKESLQNPFKCLKGFCVSPAAREPLSEQPAAAPPSAAQPAQNEAALFAGEMVRLGVARRSPEEPPTENSDSRATDPSPHDAIAPPTDQELFLASLGAMESVFVDGIPSAEETAAVPRRMRQVRRGELVPEAQLDLHGFHRADARERVRHFLDNSVYHGYKTVLIVTGRGKGSGGEPVLRVEIERYLQHEAAAWVAEWGRAPARYGGEGALVVFLKGRQGRK